MKNKVLNIDNSEKSINANDLPESEGPGSVNNHNLYSKTLTTKARKGRIAVCGFQPQGQTLSGLAILKGLLTPKTFQSPEDLEASDVIKEEVNEEEAMPYSIASSCCY